MIETDIIIIGAGPVGLFTVFEAGLLKLRCHIIDVLPQAGGQLTEIYPKKPIYDIPGFPEVLAGDLIDNLMKQVEQTRAKTKLVFLPFNGSSILKATEKEAACMMPKMNLGSNLLAPEYELHAPQVASAHHLLSCVLTSKDGAPSYDLRHFSSVEFAVVIPPSQSYFHQILHQVDRSNVLVELGLSPPTQSKDAGFCAEHVIQ